jgi:hypothetical protein
VQDRIASDCQELDLAGIRVTMVSVDVPENVVVVATNRSPQRNTRSCAIDRPAIRLIVFMLVVPPGGDLIESYEDYKRDWTIGNEPRRSLSE